MTLLSVNVNKIALLRNSRGTNYPDLLYFVRRILDKGVRGITVHPRPDERHITRQDTRDINALLNGFPDVEFNIEGYPTEAFLALVEEVRPAQCTLVPDDPAQLTSDHGWQVADHAPLLTDVLARLRGWGVRSSLFLDPEPELLAEVKRVGADRIELYTEFYARAFLAQSGAVHAGAAQSGVAHSGAARSDVDEILSKYHRTAQAAHDLGIGVNAGHDLNLQNLPGFLAGGLIEEVSIGHALIVESLEQGLDTVLDQYLAITGAAANA